MIYFNMEASTNGENFTLNGDFGVRRIICIGTTDAGSRLEVGNGVVGWFNKANSLELEFKSYYGYPRLSHFSLFTFGLSIVLVDTVPYSSINDNYFEEGIYV